MVCSVLVLCLCCARPFLSLLCAWATVSMATRRPTHAATRSQVEYLAGRRTAHRPLISVYVTICSRFREGHTHTLEHGITDKQPGSVRCSDTYLLVRPGELSDCALWQVGNRASRPGFPSAGCPSVTAPLRAHTGQDWNRFLTSFIHGHAGNDYALALMHSRP